MKKQFLFLCILFSSFLLHGQKFDEVDSFVDVEVVGCPQNIKNLRSHLLDGDKESLVFVQVGKVFQRVFVFNFRSRAKEDRRILEDIGEESFIYYHNAFRELDLRMGSVR